MDRFQVLIFSFYREDLDVEIALVPLLSNKISRVMGTINIECSDPDYFSRIILIANKYLKSPISLMKFGKHIVIYCSGSTHLKYSVPAESDKNLYV